MVVMESIHVSSGGWIRYNWRGEMRDIMKTCLMVSGSLFFMTSRCDSPAHKSSRNNELEISVKNPNGCAPDLKVFICVCVCVCVAVIRQTRGTRGWRVCHGEGFLAQRRLFCLTKRRGTSLQRSRGRRSAGALPSLLPREAAA